MDALAGPARIDQIISLLPASDLEPEQYIDGDRLKKVMQSGKSWGYFNYDPTTQKWSIAPRSYYQQRQEFLHDPDRERPKRPRGKKRQRGELQVIKVTDWKFTIVFEIFAFFVGLAVGIGNTAQANPLLEPVEQHVCPIAKPFRPLNCPNGYPECICGPDGCSWRWVCL